MEAAIYSSALVSMCQTARCHVPQYLIFTWVSVLNNVTGPVDWHWTLSIPLHPCYTTGPCSYKRLLLSHSVFILLFCPKTRAPGYLSRYSDSQRAGCASNSGGGDFFNTPAEQTCGPTQPSEQGVLLFHGGKWDGVWRRAPTPCGADVTEKIVTPLLILWAFMGWCKANCTFTFTFTFTSLTSDCLILRSAKIFLSRLIYATSYFLPDIETRLSPSPCSSVPEYKTSNSKVQYLWCSSQLETYISHLCVTLNTDSKKICSGIKHPDTPLFIKV